MCTLNHRYSIAVIAGDGIGKEVMPAGIECVTAAAANHSISLDFAELPWGSEYYQKHGRMMPVDGLEQLSKHDSIFLGAVGIPSIPDTETLWGLLIPIRRYFEQYINLRPVKSLREVPSPLADDREIDFLIVRENNEGEYSEVGGRIYRGLPQEAAIQESVFTRFGVERVTRFAAELATARSRRITSATKSNGIVHTMPFWDEVVADTLAGSGLELESILIDALAARMVLRPWSFDRSWRRTCSATSSPIWAAHSPVRSGSPRART